MDRHAKSERTICLDSQTGKILWDHGETFDYTNDEGNGPRATPTIDGSLVFSVGATNILCCLELHSGKVVWRKDLLAEFSASNLPWGTSASPVIFEDLLLVTPGGRAGACVAALDKRTGQTRWRSLEDKAGYATPLLIRVEDKPVAVWFTGLAIVGVDPRTGKELFRSAWKTRYEHNIITPIFHDRRFFVSSGYGGGCGLIELATANGTWAMREAYRNTSMSSHYSSPVLIDGFVYGFHDGFMCCLEFATGKRRWLERGYGRGSLTVTDGRLIVQGESGNLALIRPTPDRCEKISEFTPLTGRCWTAPVVTGGKLFVRDKDTIVCFLLCDQR